MFFRRCYDHRTRVETIAKTKLTVKARAQIFLFQMNTLNPSKMPNGIKFKTEMEALKNALTVKMNVAEGFNGASKAAVRNVADKVMFVNGPTIDTLPMVRVSAYPDIITTPGDIILKRGEKTESKVSAAPISVNLNSAHSPFL
jgi:hypothetical protein